MPLFPNRTGYPAIEKGTLPRGAAVGRLLRSADGWDGCWNLTSGIVVGQMEKHPGCSLRWVAFKHRSYEPSFEPAARVEPWPGQRVESRKMRLRKSDKKAIWIHENELISTRKQDDMRCSHDNPLQESVQIKLPNNAVF